MKYERLTDKEQLKKISCYNCNHNHAGSITCERYCADGDYFELRPELERLAELEDKIEQGTLIELPCKVGDTVYWLIANKYIIECVVSLINISVDKKTYFTVWAKQKCEGVENDFSSEDLGEEWFVTREEVEKRLKELQNGLKNQ